MWVLETKLRSFSRAMSHLSSPSHCLRERAKDWTPLRMMVYCSTLNSCEHLIVTPPCPWPSCLSFISSQFPESRHKPTFSVPGLGTMPVYDRCSLNVDEWMNEWMTLTGVQEPFHHLFGFSCRSPLCCPGSSGLMVEMGCEGCGFLGSTCEVRMLPLLANRNWVLSVWWLL